MWVNLLLFNISWFGLVLIGDSFIPVAFCWLAFHLYTVPNRRFELFLIVIISSIGILSDSVLHYFSVFQFDTSNFIPAWLMTLWLAFAATISHSIKFLNNSKIYQVLAGGLFAPLSYIAGYNFGAVSFGYPVLITYFLLSAIWAPLMVLFFYIYSMLESRERAYVS